jgi:hypothetical protein
LQWISLKKPEEVKSQHGSTIRLSKKLVFEVPKLLQSEVVREGGQNNGCFVAKVSYGQVGLIQWPWRCLPECGFWKLSPILL